MKGVGGNEILLAEASKKLWAEWARAGTEWNDRARGDFERDFLRELEPALHGALQALAEIRRLLEQADRECS